MKFLIALDQYRNIHVASWGKINLAVLKRF
jgi:hypothetical protein